MELQSRLQERVEFWMGAAQAHVNFYAMNAGSALPEPSAPVTAHGDDPNAVSQRPGELRAVVLTPGADGAGLVSRSANADGRDVATAARARQPRLHHKHPRPLDPGSREDRLQEFIAKEKCSIADVYRSAKVSEREMRAGGMGK